MRDYALTPFMVSDLQEDAQSHTSSRSFGPAEEPLVMQLPGTPLETRNDADECGEDKFRGRDWVDVFGVCHCAVKRKFEGSREHVVS